jgi:hypothetical protein
MLPDRPWTQKKGDRCDELAVMHTSEPGSTFAVVRSIQVAAPMMVNNKLFAGETGHRSWTINVHSPTHGFIVPRFNILASQRKSTL